MAIYEQCVGKSEEWYTPRRLFDALGVRFFLDVAHPGLDVVDWVPADFVITDRSLEIPWGGFVWMNAPFGGRNGLVPWLEKFFKHGNGVALVPDRTSAPWWQVSAERSDAVLFVRSKIQFIGSNGKPGNTPAQGTTLMAIGEEGVQALRNAERAGLGVLMVRMENDNQSS